MIQFITHHTGTISYLDSVRLALEGGCRWLQLRMKDASSQERREAALLAQRLCREAGATFIIDDDVELVHGIGANGVHLGKDDMPVAQARRILGPQCIIGGTANTLEDIRRHWKDGANYIGCGPFTFTTTKEKLAPTLGLEGYRRIVEGMRQEGIDLPIVAIGGITTGDIPAIMATGVTGIALSGAILRAANPVEEMRRIIDLI